MRSDTSQTRIRVLGGGFVLTGLLLVLRLYFVQIVHGQEYVADAMGQYVSAEQDTGARGNIFFTDKTGNAVAAAVMQTGWRLAITPKDIENPQATFTALSALTPMDQQRFFASVAKKGDPYEEVAFRISDDAGKAIRAKKIPGVMLVQDQWRFYPAHELASQAVGFVGYKGDKKTGVYGLEKYYNDTLVQKTDGAQMNPFAEIFANAQAILSTDPRAQQGSIITSIEPAVERQLGDVLSKVMETYSSKLSGGIVMDPKTGKIIAMALTPNFDPNTYNLVSDHSVFSNSLVEGRYEMGSIMKPLTMAAGMDSGAVSLHTTYNDTGCISVSGKKVCNFDFKARGIVPMQEILNQSLNLGVSFVVGQMGHEKFSKYVSSLGFGEKTEVDLPDEVLGNIASLQTGSDIDYDTASFGQGIAVSPIEMTRALSTLANGGVLPSPHVVTGIKYDSGLTRSISFPEGRRVFKQDSAEIVTNMLVKVFDTALLHGELKQDHYSIAAKTGTAQIGIPGGGGYYADRYLHSFFGYFPAHDPKFIVFLFTVEPHGVQYASASLAHPFMDLAKYIINYYQIPPDR